MSWMPDPEPSGGEGDGEGKADMAATPHHHDVEVERCCWFPHWVPLDFVVATDVTRRASGPVEVSVYVRHSHAA